MKNFINHILITIILFMSVLHAQTNMRNLNNQKGLTELTKESLLNTKYFSYEFAEDIKLINGYCDKSDSLCGNCYVQFVTQEPCDLNNDQFKDAIVVLGAKTDGTGFFEYIYPVLNKNGQPLALKPLYLGDRAVVKKIEKKTSIINLLLELGREDGTCCPPKEEIWKLKFKDSSFVIIDKKVP